MVKKNNTWEQTKGIGTSDTSSAKTRNKGIGL